MNKQQAKKAGLKRRERRVRAKIFGTAERPRLSVHRTNANIYAQPRPRVPRHGQDRLQQGGR